jgi:type I restriction enzyme S subunit
MKLKYLVDLAGDRAESRPEEFRYIGLEDIRPKMGELTNAQEEVGEESIDGISTVNLFQKGDILFGKLRPYLAKAWVCEFDGACTTEALVLRPRREILPRFLLRIILSDEFIRKVDETTFGSKMPRADWQSIGDIEIERPGILQQASIAEFIDERTNEIDALVAEKQKLLGTLAEKRRALITHAVTQGLDPKVPMRDSSIPWLGKIPGHWKPTKIGRLFRQIKRLGFPDLTVLSVYREFGVIERSSRDDNANKVPEDLEKYQLVEVGDLVVNKMKAWQGSLGISSFLGITSPDYVVFQPTHKELSEFLHYRFRASLMTSVYLSISNGIRTSQWRIEPDRFLDLPIFLPDLSEQKAIVEYVQTEIAKLDNLAVATESTIALLQERRSALISAAVSGQMEIGEKA